MKLLATIAFAATLTLLTSGPTQAQTPDPQDVLSQMSRMLDQRGTALEVDVFFSAALGEARSAGPLSPDWARPMVVTANLIIEGLCKYERGLALLDEAEVLADVNGDAFTANFAQAWKGYHRARFGLSDIAQEGFDGLPEPLAIYLDPELARDALSFVIEYQTVESSPGFLACTELMQEASRLMSAGNLEEARSFLLGLYLPPELQRDPIVVIANATVAMNIATLLDQMGRDDSSDYVKRAIDDLTVTGSNPPALRPELIDNPQNAELLADILAGLSAGTGQEPHLATARRWLEGLRAFDPLADTRDIEAQLDQAIANADWAKAVAAVEALLAEPNLGDGLFAPYVAQRESFQAMADAGNGEPIDHEALGAAFANLFAAPNVAAQLRIDAASLITQAFRVGGQGYLAYLTGVETWRYLLNVQSANAQSGDAVAAQGQRIRVAADVAIWSGFDVAAQPPDGAAPPPGLCQVVYDIEICTILLEQP